MKQLTLESLKSDIDALNKNIDRLKTSLQEAEREREALQLVIRRYSETPKKRRRTSIVLRIDPSELTGMPLETALIHIAKNNSGQIQSTPVRNLLVEAEVLTGSQPGSALWHELDSSDRFERVSRGVYRLTDIPD